MLRIFLDSFILALGSGYLILRYASAGVPRIGGVPVFIGSAAASALAIQECQLSAGALLLALACLLPPLAIGLAADLTKRVPPAAALVASFVSGGLAYVLL